MRAMDCRPLHKVAIWLVKKEIQAELGRAALKSNAAEATYSIYHTLQWLSQSRLERMLR